MSCVREDREIDLSTRRTTNAEDTGRESSHIVCRGGDKMCEFLGASKSEVLKKERIWRSGVERTCKRQAGR